MAKLPMGRLVINGLVDLYNTNGIPLNVIFYYCKENDYQPCWMSFIEESTKLGWSKKGILSRLQESITDVYGKQYWEEVEKRLKLIGFIV